MCDIQGCNEEPLFEDEMENEYCEDCMERAVKEEVMQYEDFTGIHIRDDGSWIHDSDMECRG